MASDLTYLWFNPARTSDMDAWLKLADDETSAANKRKRMVIMVGPPAAGKGFFLGEPERWDEKSIAKEWKKNEEQWKAKGIHSLDHLQKKLKGKKKPNTGYGKNLPSMAKDSEGNSLFADKDIPDVANIEESDNDLRAVQYEQSHHNFQTLKDAHDEGEEAFNAALKDMWYETKDGERVNLAKHISFKDFPESHKLFHKKARKFYVSMRGWHDDARHTNPDTGKPKERFKDEARHRFNQDVAHKVESDRGFLVVDSAGEDIDVQPFQKQIEHAKANGYEVSVIFLHPEQADTELSNMARGKVKGKRMVDQQDITNWYARNGDALRSIQEASPHNFLHYHKPPPSDDPAEAAMLRDRANHLMEHFSEMSGEERAQTEGEINKILYGRPYKLDMETSYGVTLSDSMPKKPKQKDIAAYVEKLNKDAEQRAKKFRPESEEDSAGVSDSAPKSDSTKAPEPEPEPKKPEPKKPEPPSEPKPKKPEQPKSEKPEPKSEKGKPSEKRTEPPPESHDEGKDEAGGGTTRGDFLKDIGDREVPNPNPKTKKRTPTRKIKNLPWTDEHGASHGYQRGYYQQWIKEKKQSKAASRIASRAVESAMVARVAYRWEVKMAGMVADLMKQIAHQVKDELPKLDGYDVVAVAGHGPRVLVTIKGAEGDAKAIKDARTKLTQVAEHALTKEGHDDLKVYVSAVNKGDDLVVTVEIIFP